MKMKAQLAALIATASLLIGPSASLAQGQLLGTYYVSYRYNVAGSPPPWDFNPYFDVDSSPGPIHISLQPGDYSIKVVGWGPAGPNTFHIWIGNSSSGSHIGGVSSEIGTVVPFTVAAGQELTLYCYDWYTGDNPDAGCVVELYGGSQSDIVATDLSWDTASAGVNFSYEVNGADLTVDTTAALYWATGPTWADVITAPPGPAYSMTIERQQGTYGPYYVPGAVLGTPPQNATYLLLVVDPPLPNGLVAESDENNNVYPLEICALQPYTGGTHLTGLPVWADRDFFPSLDVINQAAAANNVFVFVTESFRPAGYAPDGTIVPPATYSDHLVGHAIDMNVDYFDSNGNLQRCGGPLLNNCLGQPSLPAAVQSFIHAVTAAGLRWGGNFQDRDVVHIDDDIYHIDPASWQTKYQSLQACAEAAGFLVRVHSPVNILITDPLGRRLGVNTAGQPVNDIGSNGLDSGPGEPRTFAIKKALQGKYAIQVVGTGTGTFTIELFYSMLAAPPLNDAQPLTQPVLLTGNATVGSSTTFSFAIAPEETSAIGLPPVCNPSGPYAAECATTLTTVHLDGTGSSDPNGSPLTFLWTSDCPGAVFDDPASPTPTLFLNSGTIPETCNVMLTVSNTFGLTSTCTTTVSVKDTTPPTLTCPTGVVVEFVNETGALATFSATATDLCSAVTITYTPPSDSLFPIGVTPVYVQAIDTSSNIAQCAFDVTVLGARGVKSNILAELVTLRATASTRVDCWELDEAIEDMIDALGLDVPAAPSWVHNAHRAPNCRNHHRHPRVPLWLDETHVNPDAAWWVFSSEKDAVKELLAVIKSKKSTIPDATAQDLINRIVKCDRLLAVVAIQDATAAGARPRRIDQAQRELAQGDQDAAAGRSAQAVEHYWHAWFFAAFAVPDVVRTLDQ